MNAPFTTQDISAAAAAIKSEYVPGDNVRYYWTMGLALGASLPVPGKESSYCKLTVQQLLAIVDNGEEAVRKFFRARSEGGERAQIEAIGDGLWAALAIERAHGGHPHNWTGWLRTSAYWALGVDVRVGAIYRAAAKDPHAHFELVGVHAERLDEDCKYAIWEGCRAAADIQNGRVPAGMQEVWHAAVDKARALGRFMFPMGTMDAQRITWESRLGLLSDDEQFELEYALEHGESKAA